MPRQASGQQSEVCGGRSCLGCTDPRRGRPRAGWPGVEGGQAVSAEPNLGFAVPLFGTPGPGGSNGNLGMLHRLPGSASKAEDSAEARRAGAEAEASTRYLRPNRRTRQG